MVVTVYGELHVRFEERANTGSGGCRVAEGGSEAGELPSAISIFLLNWCMVRIQLS
jgi:hypothetical protein